MTTYADTIPLHYTPDRDMIVDTTDSFGQLIPCAQSPLQQRLDYLASDYGLWGSLGSTVLGADNQKHFKRYSL